MGYFALSQESSWVVQGSSLTTSAADDASTTSAVEPVLTLVSAGSSGARPLIRLLPHRDLPAGFDLPASADIPSQNPVLADDRAMAQTSAFPIRAFLGLEPEFDLSSISEVRMGSLRVVTSAHGAVFSLEAWCVPLP